MEFYESAGYLNWLLVSGYRFTFLLRNVLLFSFLFFLTTVFSLFFPYLFIYFSFFFHKKNTFDSRYEHERICYITRKILMIEMIIAEQRNKQQN